MLNCRKEPQFDVLQGCVPTVGADSVREGLLAPAFPRAPGSAARHLAYAGARQVHGPGGCVWPIPLARSDTRSLALVGPDKSGPTRVESPAFPESRVPSPESRVLDLNPPYAPVQTPSACLGVILSSSLKPSCRWNPAFLDFRTADRRTGSQDPEIRVTPVRQQQ